MMRADKVTLMHRAIFQPGMLDSQHQPPLQTSRDKHRHSLGLDSTQSQGRSGVVKITPRAFAASGEFESQQDEGLLGAEEFL